MHTKEKGPINFVPWVAESPHSLSYTRTVAPYHCASVLLLKAWLRGRRAYYVSQHPHPRHPRHAAPIGTAGKRRLDQQETLEQNHPWSPRLRDLRVRFPAGAGSAGTCLVGEGTGDVRAALRVAPRRLRWWPVPSPAAGRALFGVTFLTPGRFFDFFFAGDEWVGDGSWGQGSERLLPRPPPPSAPPP